MAASIRTSTHQKDTAHVRSSRNRPHRAQLMPGTRTTGRIVYRTTDGRETGRERFELITTPAGVTLRAFCEMDDVALTRDVTLAMDVQWRPLDGFCRINRNGMREAALWFDVGDKDVHLNGWIAGQRVQPEPLALPEPLMYLGLHPLQGDALIVNARGTDRPGVFVAIPCATNSISPDGDEAVGIRPVTIEVAYLGEETLDVPAGTFAARRYALRWDPSWPAADLWVRRDDCVFLRMDWSHVAARYLLTELTEEAYP